MNHTLLFIRKIDHSQTWAFYLLRLTKRSLHRGYFDENRLGAGGGRAGQGG